MGKVADCCRSTSSSSTSSVQSTINKLQIAKASDFQAEPLTVTLTYLLLTYDTAPDCQAKPITIVHRSLFELFAFSGSRSLIKFVSF